MNIEYNFYIKVEINGNKTPIMEFFPKQFNELTHLGFYEFSKSIEVKNILNKILFAKNNNIPFAFASDDWVIVDVFGDESIITNGFNKFQPFKLNTTFFIKLFSDWILFLEKYENNEIPGLCF